MILNEAFKRIDSILSEVPDNVLDNLKYHNLKKIALERGEEAKISLFVSYCTIFQFIAREEGIEIDQDVLLDYTTLNLLEFFNCTCYDKVYDDKDIQKLPVANILFRHYISQAQKVDLNIDKARSAFDLYYYRQRVIKVGKIDISQAKMINETWFRVIDGFVTSINIVENFVKRYINGSKWITFFKYYLLLRQLTDDVNDFVEDYRNGELKTFGILALVKYFKNKIKINLKNPFTSFQYQIYMLKNYKQIYQDLVSRFEEEASIHIEMDDFYKILERLEVFQVRGELY